MGRFPGAYIAYRTWTLRAGRLYPAITATPWQSEGPTRATCEDSQLHNAPVHDCHCGLHGYFEPPEELYSDNGALGAIVWWGRYEAHFDGIRAEFALPIALCRMLTMMVGADETARLYCEEWDIPYCLSIEELEQEARRYADPLPEELRGPAESGSVDQLPPPTINGVKRGTLVPSVSSTTAFDVDYYKRTGIYTASNTAPPWWLRKSP